MDADQGTRRFRRGRFVVLLAMGVAINLAVVECYTPERHFRAGDASAEVELRFDSERPPTADQVRHRALSRSNLSTVYERLTGDAAESAVVNQQFDRWRDQIAVEVRSGRSLGRKRIRFVVETEQSAAGAAILAETVAAQYAADVAAERRLAIAKQTRRADERTVAADKEPNPSGDELVELMHARARLLETMQPAHPDVVALDARLDKLRAVAVGSQVRRASAEHDASQPELEEPLGSEAAEIPVITTTKPAVRPWQHRSFWHVAACLPALCLAWLSSRRGRQAAESLVRITVPVRGNRAPARVVVIRRRDRSASNAN